MAASRVGASFKPASRGLISGFQSGIVGSLAETRPAFTRLVTPPSDQPSSPVAPAGNKPAAPRWSAPQPPAQKSADQSPSPRLATLSYTGSGQRPPPRPA